MNYWIGNININIVKGILENIDIDLDHHIHHALRLVFQLFYQLLLLTQLLNLLWTLDSLNIDMDILEKINKDVDIDKEKRYALHITQGGKAAGATRRWLS